MALQPVDTITTDAESYKGNDIDSDGDGAVDQADDADTVDGKHASDLGGGVSAHDDFYASAGATVSWDTGIGNATPLVWSAYPKNGGHVEYVKSPSGNWGAWAVEESNQTLKMYNSDSEGHHGYLAYVK